MLIIKEHQKSYKASIIQIKPRKKYPILPEGLYSPRTILKDQGPGKYPTIECAIGMEPSWEKSKAKIIPFRGRTK
jgi:hypothetical protein